MRLGSEIQVEQGLRKAGAVVVPAGERDHIPSPALPELSHSPSFTGSLVNKPSSEFVLAVN